MPSATGDQKKAAKQLRGIAGFNEQTTVGQLNRTLGDYDRADRQNRALAGTQLKQNSKQTATDRFAQAKKLQSSTRGILSAAGNAMQGSQFGSLASMVRSRSDLDTGEALGTLTTNQGAVRNSLDESLNANVMARRDAINTAIAGLRGISSDTSAQMSSIHPSLYHEPKKNKLEKKLTKRLKGIKEHKSKLAGYFLPTATGTNTAPAMQGTSYFDTLMNEYNQRSA